MSFWAVGYQQILYSTTKHGQGSYQAGLDTKARTAPVGALVEQVLNARGAIGL